jgi:transcriptional regulator with XRE-family HTH domain
MFLNMSISRRIRELRLEKNMSGKNFSMAINVDNSQYSKIEKGKSDLTLKHLMEIYSKFNVSINWLLMGEGEKYVVSKLTPEAFVHNEIQGLNREIGALSNENKRIEAEAEKLKAEIKKLKAENEELKISTRKKSIDMVGVDNQELEIV